MKTIYVDSEFRCYVSNDGTMTPIETDYFNDKCDAFIEGYRFIPEGESWANADGEVFYGEMISPWKDYSILEATQKLYEEMNASAIKEERIAALEAENAMLMECILEMSEIIYA